jgi:hypothetical protein
MIAELIQTFDNTLTFITRCVDDLSEQQMVEQPPEVPNHATWTLGHMIFSCQGVAVELGVKPWLPDDWESRFGYGSTPVPDATHYPKKSEMLSLLSDASACLRDTLLAVDQSVLDRSLPDETMPTMRHVLMQVVAGHSAYHAGQLSVWRRAIGMPSAGVFI